MNWPNDSANGKAIIKRIEVGVLFHINSPLYRVFSNNSENIIPALHISINLSLIHI